MHQNVTCTICGQDTTELVFSKWSLDVVRCLECGLVYVNPRSIVPETDEYFRGPYLDTIESDGVLRPGVQAIYDEILDRVDAYLAPGRLLDVGCAMGHFMAEASKRGWKVHGVEPCAYAADYARNRWGLRTQPVANLQDAHLPDEHFDACVLVEVAEHLSDPRATFVEAFRLLKPGGLLYATTPNFACFLSILQREDWEPVIPTGHLYYFTAETLGRLLRSIGFESLVNLTVGADFDRDLGATRAAGRLRLNDAEVERARSRVAMEDAEKLVNGRGEGLVLCASKPRNERNPLCASLRDRSEMPPLENRLVATADDGRVFLVRQNRRHWVTNVDWLARHGMKIEDTIQIDPGVMRRLFLGPPLGA